MTLAPGTRLGPYEVVGTIGAGGMGEVYRARDPKLNRFVALKILHGQFSADPDRLARFEREAQAVAALSHPGILAIHDFGTANGVTYAVMELLEGSTLRQRVASGAMAPQRAIGLIPALRPRIDSVARSLPFHDAVSPPTISHANRSPASFMPRYNSLA